MECKKKMVWYGESSRHREAALKAGRERGVRVRCVKQESAVAFIEKKTPSLTGYKPYSQKKVFMHPNIFLYYAAPTRLDRGRVEFYKNRMRTGKSVEPLFFDVDIDSGRVLAHEGRHRAKAANELGIYDVPVILYYKRKGVAVDITDEELPERLSFEKYY